MSFPKLIFLLSVLLFGTIGITFLMKGRPKEEKIVFSAALEPQVIDIAIEGPEEAEEDETEEAEEEPASEVDEEEASVEEVVFNSQSEKVYAPAVRAGDNLPIADHIAELFNTRGPKLPFVETITYKSRVEWQQGRPAWLSDYAGHYKTSRHFIARSLNGKPDYFKQDLSNGDRFNVFKTDKDISFYLLIDTSRCKMWFYAFDQDSDERTLLKTYDVGLGRLDSSQVSGLLTPLGRYNLGERVAIYKPKSMGFFNGERVEMVRIFGTRWIPFESLVADAVESAKGLGIHGVPWIQKDQGQLTADESSIGKYESDGCIRMATHDIEEIFSIIITKSATVELVRDFHEAHLPGVEKSGVK